MAFPSILQASTFQKDNANVTTFEVTRPAGLTNDNTLLIIFATDGDPTIDMSADGLTHVGSGSNNTVTMRAAYRKIDGTEPTTFTVTTDNVQRACAVAYEIQDAADPGVDAPTENTTFGTSATPDPSIHTPAGGAKDFLWVAAVGVDRDRTIDSFPANMTIGSSQQNVDGGGANSCSIGTDTHQVNASSFNPDTFGISASDGWIALTINISPAAAAAGPIHLTMAPYIPT